MNPDKCKIIYMCKFCKGFNTSKEIFNGMPIVVCRDCKSSMLISEAGVFVEVPKQFQE